jgi:acyl-CoA thioesterase-1
MKYIDAHTKMTDVAKGKQWVPVDQYDLQSADARAAPEETGAKLVWCSTTPVPTGVSGRIPGQETVYNAAALRVMQAEKVPVDDLCAFVGTPEHRIALGGRLKDVHYNADGYQALAGEVAKAISAALPTR